MILHPGFFEARLVLRLLSLPRVIKRGFHMKTVKPKTEAIRREANKEGPINRGHLREANFSGLDFSQDWTCLGIS